MVEKLFTKEDYLLIFQKECKNFDSFDDMKIFYSEKVQNCEENFDNFLNELTKIFQTMFQTTSSSQRNEESPNFKNNPTNIKTLIQENQNIFKSLCSVLNSIMILSDNILGKKIDDEMLENFKILKNKASAHKKIKKFKKSYKNYLAKISTISKTTPVKKIFLRLIPKTNQTHQLMMKMNNFPRLELRISIKTKLQTIFDYLNKKWLTNYRENFIIDLFPDEKKWLTQVNFDIKETSCLAGNFMLHDLILAYNFPDNDVIYLFYEIKNTNKRSSPHKKAQKSIKKFVKNDKNMLPSIKFNEIATKSNPFENLDFFESKRKSFSNFSEKSQLELPNNNNSQCNKSFSLYSFSQRIPFKQTENFNSPFSNIRILNINDKTYNNNAENCELSSFLKKNLDYGESFLGISQSYEKKVSKNCNSLINFNESELRALNSEEKIKKNRKDPHHFQKITKIIDSLGNDDTSFATFKKESFPKKIIKFE